MSYDYKKVVLLKKQRMDLMKQMREEKDFKKRKEFEYKVKIMDCRIAIERLKN